MACKDCKFFELQRNPATGRTLPSLAGRCAYEVAWPTLPACYWPYLAIYRTADLPYPHCMHSWEGNGCPVAQPKKSEPKPMLEDA